MRRCQRESDTDLPNNPELEHFGTITEPLWFRRASREGLRNIRHDRVRRGRAPILSAGERQRSVAKDIALSNNLIHGE